MGNESSRPTTLRTSRKPGQSQYSRTRPSSHQSHPSHSSHPSHPSHPSNPSHKSPIQSSRKSPPIRPAPQTQLGSIPAPQAQHGSRPAPQTQFGHGPQKNNREQGIDYPGYYQKNMESPESRQATVVDVHRNICRMMQTSKCVAVRLNKVKTHLKDIYQSVENSECDSNNQIRRGLQLETELNRLKTDYEKIIKCLHHQESEIEQKNKEINCLVVEKQRLYKHRVDLSETLERSQRENEDKKIAMDRIFQRLSESDRKAQEFWQLDNIQDVFMPKPSQSCEDINALYANLFEHCPDEIREIRNRCNDNHHNLQEILNLKAEFDAEVPKQFDDPLINCDDQEIDKLQQDIEKLHSRLRMLETMCN